MRDVSLFSACGGTFTASEGFIESPNYPDSYPPRLNCEYKIRLDVGKRLVLNFMKVEIERSATCRFDSLQVSQSFLYRYGIIHVITVCTLA